MGVEDVAFAKRRGLKISEMAKSTWVYKRLLPNFCMYKDAKLEIGEATAL